MENNTNYWTYPEGFEKVCELADFLPEEERPGYVDMVFHFLLSMC